MASKGYTTKAAVNAYLGKDSGLSDAAEYTYGAASTDYAAVATGGTGGSTGVFAIKQDIDLQGCKRYVRVSVTPNLSATGTDVATIGFGILAIGESGPLT
jgi:hypothetical protein